MSDTTVLIAGAGPTGLVLALALARRGVAFRIIDENTGPGEHSRAMVVHARTLEFYRQFGFADAVVAAGIPLEGVHLREGGAAERAGRDVLSVRFAAAGGGISPYPFVLCYPQDDHERFLVDRLREAGVEVERGVRLEGFSRDKEGVSATLAHAGERREAVRAAYLCGCDGAHSRVRGGLDVGFPGGTYDQRFFVADVALDAGFRRDVTMNLGERSFVLLLPVRSSGTQRLIGIVPAGLDDRDDLNFEDLRCAVEPLIDARVTALNWFATYRVHHRVADRFRDGRVFLAGDAGHIHSPAGGQGMNTGIGDAVNLGWKLAEVTAGRADPAILDTYEAERIAFARQLVATTDRAFTSIVAGGLAGRLVRRLVAPAVLAAATGFEAGRRAFFRTVSQTRIGYRGGPLSEGRAGAVKGGDRLPWTGEGGPDNFAPLATLGWQAHVHGAPNEKLLQSAARLGLPVHAFAWSEAAAAAGYARDAFHLVRPDGHVGLALPAEAGAAALEAYVSRWRLGFAGSPAAP